MKAENGKIVEVHYTGKHENGEVFDSSIPREKPLEVTIGAGQVIPGFDEALVGMAIGEKKTVTITPDKAYGEIMTEAIQEIPLANLPEGIKTGDSLQGQGPDGRPMIAKVDSVNGDVAKIDFNHPLAGKTITFDIEMVGIN